MTVGEGDAPVVISKKETKGVLLYLPVELNKALEKLAKDSGRTKSELAAKAIDRFLRKAVIK